MALLMSNVCCDPLEMTFLLRIRIITWKVFNKIQPTTAIHLSKDTLPLTTDLTPMTQKLNWLLFLILLQGKLNELACGGLLTLRKTGGIVFSINLINQLMFQDPYGKLLRSTTLWNLPFCLNNLSVIFPKNNIIMMITTRLQICLLQSYQDRLQTPGKLIIDVSKTIYYSLSGMIGIWRGSFMLIWYSSYTLIKLPNYKNMSEFYLISFETFNFTPLCNLIEIEGLNLQKEETQLLYFVNLLLKEDILRQPQQENNIYLKSLPLLSKTHILFQSTIEISTTKEFPFAKHLTRIMDATDLSATSNMSASFANSNFMESCHVTEINMTETSNQLMDKTPKQLLMYKSNNNLGDETSNKFRSWNNNWVWINPQLTNKQTTTENKSIYFFYISGELHAI